MKKLYLNLEVIDGYPPVSMENIWAEVTEEGYLKVNNIPFYSKEISLGDIAVSYTHLDVYKRQGIH